MVSTKASKIPNLIYGTAWKKDQTQALVKQALINGFRGIDTAAQPKHYQEHLVGAGIRDAIHSGHLERKDLYIQTKFTSLHGQDPKKLPYDPQSSLQNQINASIASSLNNLRNTSNPSNSYLDCCLLHSPLPTLPLTLQALKTLESHHPHHIRSLGLSNCYSLPLLREIYSAASVKPSVLQNRFYADTSYDKHIRAFCREHQIRYQSFWTLTANPHLLQSEPVETLATEARVGRAVALYGLVIGLGNVSVLNGTKSEERMREDLAGVVAIQRWKEAHPHEYAQLQKGFEELLV